MKLDAENDYLVGVDEELESLWRETLAEAEIKARNAGEKNFDEYLALKAANDEVRHKACGLLLRIFAEIARQAAAENPFLQIDSIENHQFTLHGATMHGSLLRLKQGVRSLTIEAGFPRLPKDGFVRGNGLAVARISHFGISKHNQELILARYGSNSPHWFIVENETSRREFGQTHIAEHFKVFFEI